MDKITVTAVLKTLYELFPDAHSVAVADMERFIFYTNSKELDLQLAVGDAVELEQVTSEALLLGKEVACAGKFRDVTYYAVSKPLIHEDELCGAMTAFYSKKPQSLATPFITIRTTDRWIPLHFRDVIFMEAQNRKTHVTSVHAKGTHRFNLKELEQVLPEENFFRCHRSYIINLQQVQEIQPDSHATFIFIMKDASRVPVSQNYVRQARKLFGF